MIFKDKTILKALWAGMFFLCALLGFVPQPEGANRWLLFGFSLLFFLPPALLLWQGKVTRDRKLLKLMRNLSIFSLSGTLLLLLGNFLSILVPESVGNALYYLLIVISTPMGCCGYYFLSLFLWAILLWCSLFFLQECKK